MKQFISLTILAALFFTSCKKDDVTTPSPSAFAGQATVSFDAVAGSEDFALDKDFTIAGRTYNFSQLRYWVSNVSLVTSSGTEYKVPGSYYLLEETKAVAVQDGSYQYPATKREDVLIKDIPAGDYATIKFSIGVDQKYNDNLSLQSGELSQLNGMTNISWMWHTSYIFSSLAGKVTEGPATKDISVETGLNASYKSLSFTLPRAVHIDAATSGAVKLGVDVAKIIDGIDLIANPTVGATQADLMAKVADNYATKAMTVISTVK